MTVISFCCYHCASFNPDKKRRQQCNKEKTVCFNAFMSVEDAEYRKDCIRYESECREQFGDPMSIASVAHSCFERKGAKLIKE